MRFYEFITEGYKEVQQKYVTSGADASVVKQTLDAFKNLVNRNQLSGDEKNIDVWGKKPFDQLKAFVDEKSSEKSATQIKRSKIPGKSINLIDNDEWLVVIPLDKDASCFHGKGSDWCTTKQNQSHFESYFYNSGITLIYCLNKKTGGMWAIAAGQGRIDMFNQQDNPIDMAKFNADTGLNVEQILDKANAYHPIVSKSRSAYGEAFKRIKNYLRTDVRERNSQIEQDLMLTKDADLCLDYMERIRKKEDYPVMLQLLAVNTFGSSINYILNPTEKVKLAGVNQNAHTLQWIDNPSEQVQLAAVNKHGVAIRYIKNPSEQVQLAAVRSWAESIQYIKNPSEQVQFAAIELSGKAIQWIDNPSIEMQILAVQKDANAIQYIENPSEQVKLAAVNREGLAIQHIRLPSEQVQLTAVKRDGKAIQYISNPSEQIQMAAVEQDPWALEDITNPSEQVQLTAVTQTPHVIYYIKNPSDAVKKAAGKE